MATSGELSAADRAIARRARELHRELGAGKALERVMKAQRGRRPAGSRGRPVLLRGRRPPQIGATLRGGEAAEAGRGRDRVVDSACGEMDVDERREQRANHRRCADARGLVVRDGRSALEQVSGTSEVATDEVEAGEGAHRIGVCFEPDQQVRRLLESALADTQVREADGRRRTAFGAPVEVVGRLTSSDSASGQRPAAVRMAP